MAVPDFQSIMLPLLKIAGDMKEHSVSESVDVLAQEFRLTEDDRKELLSSGRQTRFDNRVGWTRTYLKKAGLLEYTGMGKFRITQRGLEVLSTNPKRINVKFLKQFPEFLEFQKFSQQVKKEVEKPDESEKTPEEILADNYQYLRDSVAHELLERIRSCSAKFFEELVLDLLVAMGYGGSRKDAERVGRIGDGGIDGTIKEDKLGLDFVYVQAKRWQGTVGRPVVQAFAGSLEGQRARKGVLITTSNFSPDAKDYVEKIEKKIVLIDGEQLSQLMIDHGIGVTEVASYAVKKVDHDYFSEE
jgi:restriction system protein